MPCSGLLALTSPWFKARMLKQLLKDWMRMMCEGCAAQTWRPRQSVWGRIASSARESRSSSGIFCLYSLLLSEYAYSCQQSEETACDLWPLYMFYAKLCLWMNGFRKVLGIFLSSVKCTSPFIFQGWRTSQATTKALIQTSDCSCWNLSF